MLQEELLMVHEIEQKMNYHDIDAWKARIAKVKSDNPKE